MAISTSSDNNNWQTDTTAILMGSDNNNLQTDNMECLLEVWEQKHDKHYNEMIELLEERMKNSLEYKDLHEALHAKNYEVEYSTGKGNCFFDVVAKQLHQFAQNKVSQYASGTEIRQATANYLISNVQLFYVTSILEVDELPSNFVQRMFRNEEWGDKQVLHACAKALDVCLNIINATSTRLIVSVNEKASDELYILYSGHHYMSLNLAKMPYVPVSGNDYYWRPQKDHFDDDNDPRRWKFDGSLDYRRNIDPTQGIDHFADAKVQLQYRNLQIASQMHVCQSTCWKYLKRNPQRNKSKKSKDCRFEFPQDAINFKEDDSVINSDKDRHGRKRVRMLPPRNNGNLNATYCSPLMFLIINGNMDNQWIQNEHGAAEYCCDYASKVDAPDISLISNLFAKKLAQYMLDQQKHGTFIDRAMERRNNYKAIGEAIIASQQIGSVQACYALLHVKYIRSTH